MQRLAFWLTTVLALNELVRYDVPGGLICNGMSHRNSDGILIMSCNTAGNQHAAVMVYDNGTNFKTVLFNPEHYVYSIAVNVNQTTGDIYFASMTSSNNWDSLATRLFGSNFTRVWATTLSSPGFDVGCYTVTLGQSVYIVSQVAGSLLGSTYYGSDDATLTQLHNQNGTVIKNVQVGTTGSELGFMVMNYLDQKIIFGGPYQDTSAFIACYWPNLTNIWITTLASTGQTGNAKLYNGHVNQDDGGIYVHGDLISGSIDGKTAGVNSNMFLRYFINGTRHTSWSMIQPVTGTAHSHGIVVDYPTGKIVTLGGDDLIYTIMYLNKTIIQQQQYAGYTGSSAVFQMTESRRTYFTFESKFVIDNSTLRLPVVPKVTTTRTSTSTTLTKTTTSTSLTSTSLTKTTTSSTITLTQTSTSTTSSSRTLTQTSTSTTSSSRTLTQTSTSTTSSSSTLTQTSTSTTSSSSTLKQTSTSTTQSTGTLTLTPASTTMTSTSTTKAVLEVLPAYTQVDHVTSEVLQTTDQDIILTYNFVQQSQFDSLPKSVSMSQVAIQDQSALQKLLESSQVLLYGAIGVGAVILVLVIVLVWFCMRRKAAKSKSRTNDSWTFGTSTEYSTVMTGSQVTNMNTTSMGTYLVTSHVLTVPKYLEHIYGVDFREGKMIAQGAGGSIFRAKSLNPSKFQNDEIVSKNTGVRTDEMHQIQLDSFYQEIAVLNVVRDQRYFAKFYGYSVSPATIILKYYPLGSLKYFIARSSKFNGFVHSKSQLLPIMVKLAKGYAFMHTKNLAHCDIKPDNVLLEAVNGILEPRITDFGISCSTVDNSQLEVQAFKVSQARGFSINQASPEAISRLRNRLRESDGRIYKMGDVYSNAIVLMELLQGRVWPK